MFFNCTFVVCTSMTFCLFSRNSCIVAVGCTVKVLEKRHIVRERKTQYVKREKEVLMRIDHPFFVKLHFTFQDDDRLCILYYYMTHDTHAAHMHSAVYVCLSVTSWFF